MTIRSIFSFLLESLHIIGRTIRAHIIIAACNGLVASLGFMIVGLPYAWLLGLVVMLFSLVPLVGSLVAFIPALILAWFTFYDFWALLWVGLVWPVIQLLEMLVWQPWILGHQLEVNPWLVLLVMLLAGLFFGFFGMILAVPVLAVMQLLVRRIKKTG